MDAFEARNALVFSEFEKQKDIVETVYPHRVLCRAAHCAVERQDKALYIDEDHLSRAGAEMVSAIFDPVLAGDP
jgi:hypothetical protein